MAVMSSAGCTSVDRAELPPLAPPELHTLIEQFLLSRRVRNCSVRTLEIYEANLRRFAVAVGSEVAACTPHAVQQYLTELQSRMKPISVHQHYRVLRTFFAWAVLVGAVAGHPLNGLDMKAPKTFPRVPEDDDVRRLLAACPDTWEGYRACALIALLADSGLRVSEALHLRIEDVNLSKQTLYVHAGKGGKDGTGFLGDTTALHLRAWLGVHPRPDPAAFLIVSRAGHPITRYHVCHMLHRLSVRAGLPRKVGPHALRHYAATALLRRTGDLELVRRVLRHETLMMTIRYAHLATLDVAARFLRASPVDHLGAAARPHAPGRRAS